MYYTDETAMTDSRRSKCAPRVVVEKLSKSCLCRAEQPIKGYRILSGCDVRMYLINFFVT